MKWNDLRRLCRTSDSLSTNAYLILHTWALRESRTEVSHRALTHTPSWYANPTTHLYPLPLVLTPHDHCVPLFGHPHIIKNDRVLVLDSPLLFFPSVSFSPSLCSNERQALSRQWHSKTSGLGSSVSGYSTLLGAISLSKVRPAHSPTENPQISYYSLHTEGRHSCFISVCMYAKTKMEVTKLMKICIWGCQRTACGERESDALRPHVLQIYEWVLVLTWLHLLKVSTWRSQAQSQTPKPCSPWAALKQNPTTADFAPGMLPQASIHGTVVTSSNAAAALIRNSWSDTRLWYRSCSVVGT